MNGNEVVNTAALLLNLFSTAADATARIRALYDVTTAEGRGPTQEELDALDLRDGASRKALQDWIDAQP